MKKITMLVAALGVSSFLSAQTILSHSVDNTYMDFGSVACQSDPDQVPQCGDESVSDNIYYRSYTPADFITSSGFEVQGANFWVSFQDIGGTNPIHEATLRFYSVAGTFPSGTLTEIASKLVLLDPSQHGTQLSVLLDSPITVNASEELIVALDIPAAPEFPDNYDVRIGINEAGENFPSYLSSAGCGIAVPTPTAGIGFPDNAILLDVVGQEATIVSVGDHLAEVISVYPNPATSVLNINLPSNLEVVKSSLVDMLGKTTGVVYSNGEMNVSNLAPGVYFLNLETTAGSYTQKVVKQ